MLGFLARCVSNSEDFEVVDKLTQQDFEEPNFFPGGDSRLGMLSDQIPRYYALRIQFVCPF